MPPKSKHSGAAANALESESMQKLKALREKISKEWEQEQKERVENERKEVVVPMSLAEDYAQQPNKKGQTRRQIDKASALTREKIATLKLDKAAQRELESELEKKSHEMHSLRSHNQRLREIINLRQESNMRKEAELQTEVIKLKTMSDSVSIDLNDHDRMMHNLHTMNNQIQKGAAQLKSSIEEQAKGELLALTRRYRVRMREIKHMLNEQHRVNLEGAKAWIDRHEFLTKDYKSAEEGLKVLESKNAVLVAENKELKVMTKHQEEQRNTLTGKIAVVKRENKRIEDQIKRLEEQLLERARSRAENSNPTRMVQSRQASRKERHPSAQPMSNVDKKQAAALQRVKRSLEEMRRSLKQVRSAHIELLQERTELEMFLRQCMEDVRRDMYRFTVVNTVSRGVKGDQLEEKNILQEYGAKERKHLIDILNSKLKVLALYHENAFPQKMLNADEVLGDFMDEDTGTAGDGAEMPHSQQVVNTDVAAELDMDTLWQRWKEWNAGT